MAALGKGIDDLGDQAVNAALLKAAKRALATLRAQGYRADPGNVVEALEKAIAKAEAT